MPPLEYLGATQYEVLGHLELHELVNCKHVQIFRGDELFRLVFKNTFGFEPEKCDTDPDIPSRALRALQNIGALRRTNYLFRCAKCGSSLEMIKLLKAAGVCLRRLDYARHSAFSKAALYGNHQLLNELYYPGAQNTRDICQRNPLHLAAKKSWQCTSVLLSMGACFSARDNCGNTPLLLAFRAKSDATAVICDHIMKGRENEGGIAKITKIAKMTRDTKLIRFIYNMEGKPKKNIFN